MGPQMEPQTICWNYYLKVNQISLSIEVFLY